MVKVKVSENNCRQLILGERRRREIEGVAGVDSLRPEDVYCGYIQLSTLKANKYTDGWMDGWMDGKPQQSILIPNST